MMKLLSILFILFIVGFGFTQNGHADVCTPVKKPTKYLVKKSDHIAAILRLLDLEPVFGTKGSLPELLKINKIKNANVIEPETEIEIPFKCEEKVVIWNTVDRETDRLITLEKADLSGTASGVGAPAPTAPIEQKALDIIDADKATEEQVTTEGAPGEDSVSEALRYRMICEGEWTGSECITRYSVIYLAGVGSYYRYDGVDATTNDTAVLLSKFNPGINLGWANYWFENFKTDFGFSINALSINEEARGRPIDQNKKVISNLYGLVKYETERMGFSFGFAQLDKVFYRFFKENIVVFNDGGVTVQLVPITKIRGALSYLVHQEGKYRYDLEVGMYSLSGGKSSGYDVEAGSGWDLSMTVQHDRVQEYLFGTVIYGVSQQNTTIEKQDQTDLSLVFGYAWKMKDW
ncbi:MAG: hypothetical protein A2622_06920 [Bdellovibrionales bacterium RIFCSPHIGHO2_01_FULL_40_29]|nr:MAG: hypothetical protein A2622_06920 [Bdellovibrionales bacterium RIFCSPHIGHO2_01_FULL_40_29]